MKKVRVHVNLGLFLGMIVFINANANAQCSPDVTNPNPAILPTITAECFVTVPQATTTDFCDGTVTGTTTDPLTYSSEGFYIINWTFTDMAGNSSTATQNVIIDDVTAPNPNVVSLPDVNSECAVNSISPPTASDNCVGTVVGQTSTSFPITAQGTTVVTWTYDDNQGNVITQNQNVNILDVTAPTANLGTLPTINTQCAVSSIIPPTATDNCGGTVSGTTTTSFPITMQGTTVVTWSYSDSHGNTSSQNQLVVIDDTEPPIPGVAALSDVNGVCSVASLTAPSANDNCTGNVLGTTSTTFPITQQGTTTVIWTYTDGNGNFSTQNQTVILNDESAPVPDASSLPELMSECSITSLTAPTASDNCAGTITGYHDAILPITLQGTTVVTWAFEDLNGNVTYQTQQVLINDVTTPVPSVSSLTDIIAECSVTSLISPSATDNCVGFVNVTNNASLPITALGTHVVTWYYTDVAGNITAQNQNVIVQDNNGPVADQATLAPIVVECQLTSLIEPSASDACGGPVTISNDANLPITIPGNYSINWTFEDENGNVTTESQEVSIIVTDACLDLTTVNDVITPNGDGKNDFWVIEESEYINGCDVQIFNRWGDQIYQTTSYANDWNGESDQGEVLPQGVYYYLISCNDEISFNGFITIIR